MFFGRRLLIARHNFLQTTVFPRLVSDAEQKLSLHGLRLAVEA
jgi:hypothetical protein